jgi:hypothetical protein
MSLIYGSTEGNLDDRPKCCRHLGRRDNVEQKSPNMQLGLPDRDSIRCCVCVERLGEFTAALDMRGSRVWALWVMQQA